MIRKTVLWEFGEDDLDPEFWDRIRSVSSSVVRVDDPEQLRRELPDAEALLVQLGHKVDRALMDVGPRLNYISVFGTDTSRIDSAYAAERNIMVTNAAGYSTQAVAEFAMALTLEHFRELSRAKMQASDGNYSNETFVGREIMGTTWGVLGLGRIGGRIARLASAFGAQVNYYATEEKSEYESEGMVLTSMADLLARADVVSLNLPLTAQTEGIVDAQLVARIKPGALFLILAPIELIDFEATLARALAGELIIALNHSYELSDSQVQRLSACENCILIPPFSYLTQESRRNRQEILVSGLEEYSTGQR